MFFSRIKKLLDALLYENTAAEYWATCNIAAKSAAEVARQRPTDENVRAAEVSAAEFAALDKPHLDVSAAVLAEAWKDAPSWTAFEEACNELYRAIDENRVYQQAQYAYDAAGAKRVSCEWVCKRIADPDRAKAKKAAARAVEAVKEAKRARDALPNPSLAAVHRKWCQEFQQILASDLPTETCVSRPHFARPKRPR